MDDGTYSDLTYQEVMAEGFNIVVNTIFECDDSHWIDYNKSTIILVRCPSGEAWEKSKIEYANLLKSRLKLPERVKEPVYVAVYNKTKAVLLADKPVMAYADERETRGGTIEMDERDTGSLKTLLEEFGIPLPETLDSCNLIGLDYGDGEISANLAVWSDVKKNSNPIGLSLSESGTLMKNPNAYLIGSDVERLIYDSRDTESTKEANGIRYYNFKKCVGTVEAASKFAKDDGTYGNLTYQEIMAEGFNIAINTILKSDASHEIDYNKPTIILVGCPSSAVWERSKIEYADLLKSRLKLPEEVTKPVYVAIYKESNAVLAREIDPQWGKSRVEKGEVIVILDNGSSTFDITVVGVGGIPENGVDSYQFGGNLLDKNLLKIMQKRFKAEYPDVEPVTSHGHKLGIRIAKENYYGLDGELRKPEAYMMTLKDKVDAKGRPLKFKFEIDEDVMEEALEKMPVTALHYAGATGEMVKKELLRCDSWLDGCRKIYKSFYEKMKCYFVTPGEDTAHPVVPDRIVLSGGVSIMPEIQEVVEEVFGVKPVMSVQPNYAVSEGLAYVLITEIRKGQYLRNVLAEIQKTLPVASTLRDAIIKVGCEVDWMTYSNSMKKWSEQSGLLSIRDWSEYWYKEFNHNLTFRIQKGAEDWFKEQKIQDKVSSMLAGHFKQMFPDYEGTFEYTFPKCDFASLSGVVVTIKSSWSFFFGFLTSNEDKSSIITDEILDKKRDQAWRKRAYQNFLEMEDKIRKGGNNRISFEYEKEHLLGLWTSTETGYTNVSYEGLEAMYKESITDAVSENIRKDVLAELNEPLKEYVERITPYFQMTARE